MNDRSHLIDIHIIRLPFCFFLPLHTRDTRSRATQYSYLTIILSSSNNPIQILSLLRIYLTGSMIGMFEKTKGSRMNDGLRWIVRASTKRTRFFFKRDSLSKCRIINQNFYKIWKKFSKILLSFSNKLLLWKSFNFFLNVEEKIYFFYSAFFAVKWFKYEKLNNEYTNKFEMMNYNQKLQNREAASIATGFIAQGKIIAVSYRDDKITFVVIRKNLFLLFKILLIFPWAAGQFSIELELFYCK